MTCSFSFVSFFLFGGVGQQKAAANVFFLALRKQHINNSDGADQLPFETMRQAHCGTTAMPSSQFGHDGVWVAMSTCLIEMATESGTIHVPEHDASTDPR